MERGGEGGVAVKRTAPEGRPVVSDVLLLLQSRSYRLIALSYLILFCCVVLLFFPNVFSFSSGNGPFGRFFLRNILQCISLWVGCLFVWLLLSS